VQRLDRPSPTSRVDHPTPASWPKTSHRGVHGAEGDIRWSAEVAWIVGLMASDGNLARAGHALSLASNDVDLLESVRRILRIGNRLGRVQGGLGHACYRLQWRDRGFHAWLTGIGLTPRKSLTLGPLAVPDEYFADFFRGCIDGDGTILVYTDRYHARRKATYVYQRLYVSIVSASRPFVIWLQETIARLTGARGAIYKQVGPGPPAHLGASVCETRVVAAAAVDVLRARDAVSDAEAGQSRAVHPPTQMRVCSGARAGVSELADDPDSKSGARKGVGVRLPSPAPYLDKHLARPVTW
jgi:hypothetical protein